MPPLSLESWRQRMSPPVFIDASVPIYASGRKHPNKEPRDLVHAAVMRRLGASRIISADTDFDRLPEIVRLEPSDIAEWGDSVLSDSSA